MQTEMSKWGNSMAFRVPAAIVKAAGFELGTRMDIDFDNGRLVLTPRPTKMSRAERLEWLLADLAEHGPIEEIPAGSAQGHEVVEW